MEIQSQRSARMAPVQLTCPSISRLFQDLLPILTPTRRDNRRFPVRAGLLILSDLPLKRLWKVRAAAAQVSRPPENSSRRVAGVGTGESSAT